MVGDVGVPADDLDGPGSDQDDWGGRGVSGGAPGAAGDSCTERGASSVFLPRGESGACCGLPSVLHAVALGD